MELEMPQDVVCPLCRDETVVLQENRSERPYFRCRTFDSAVNLRPDGNKTAMNILNELAAEDVPDEDADPELEPEEAGSDETEAAEPDESTPDSPQGTEADADADTEVAQPDSQSLSDMLQGDTDEV